ncbi:polyprotein [fipivirus B1]|uniref:Genome polyprotein n=1 Tax=fipivirus B1 TaxID=2116202 RepID=A0A2P1GN36_9PICO|nr:polyprotein [fipivirus B1]AVM87405.1 polyprotein [fipivirus B1]
MERLVGSMLSKGVTGMAKAVGLANEQTEQFYEHPDRVYETSTAAFMSVSQQSVPPFVTGRKQEQRTQAAMDKPASLVTQGERPFIVATGTWTTSHQLMQRILNTTLPGAFMNPKMAVYGILAFHTFMRTGFEIEVQINPTPFQQGSLLVVAIPWQASPWAQGGIDQLDVSLRALMTLPHVLLNCNINNTGVMKIPYVYTRNLYEIHTDPKTDQLWHLMAVVYSPLKRGSTTSTVVGIRILAKLCDAEIHGLRPYTEPQMRVTVNPSIGVLNACNAVSSAPEVDLSIGPEFTPHDSTSAGGLEMKDFGCQIMSPCWLGLCTMTSTQTAGTLLYEHLIKPESPTIKWWDKDHPTNLSAMSQYYGFWRGDMIYEVQVNCTKYHSGRIMISYVPRYSKAKTFDDHMSSAVLFFDINGLNSTAMFRVPYESTTMYTPTEESIGLLTIWVVNQLAAPPSVSPNVDLVIFEAGSDTFQYFAPTWVDMAQMTSDETVEEGKVVKTEGDGATTDESKTPLTGAEAIEDPNQLVTKTGTFPEVKPGKRSHTASHIDISVMMGRARFWWYATIPEGYFQKDVDLNLNVFNGPLLGLLRFGYMYRGAMSLIITFDTDSVEKTDQNSVINVVFMPVKIGTTFQTYTSSGFARMVTGQTSAMKVKIPWYSRFTAITPWGGSDTWLGTLRVFGHAQVPSILRIDMAFTDESQMLFPMPAQIKSGYKAWILEDEDENESLPALEDLTMDETHTTQKNELTEDNAYDYSPTSSMSNLSEYKPMEGSTEVEEWFGHSPISRSEWREGDLVRYKCNKVMYHYAVYAGDGCVVHLVPDGETSYEWMTAKSGVIKHEEMRTDRVWQHMGSSPFPKLTMMSALSMLGRSRYSLSMYNCESFARQCCFLPKRTQVDTALEVITTSAVLVPAVMVGAFVGQSDEETPKKHKKKKPGILSRMLSNGISNGIDSSTAVSEVTTDVQNVAGSAVVASENVTLAANEIQGLAKKLGKMLSPKKLFGGIAKQALVIWASRITGFVLDLVALILEVIALVRSEGEIKNLLIGALAARLGSAIADVVKKINIDKAQMTGQGPSEGLVHPMIPELLAQAVVITWKRTVDEDFEGQSFIKTLQNMNTATMALTSVEKLITWIKDVCKELKAWLQPELKSSIRHRLCKRLMKNFPDLQQEVMKITVEHPKTSAEKRRTNERAAALHKRLLFYTDIVKGAKTNADKTRLLGQLMSFQVKVAKVLLETGDRTTMSRVEPVVIYLHGKKGCGKSVTSVALAKAICNAHGWDADEDVYIKPCSSEYYDGYEQQRVMIVDDIGQNTDDSDWTDFCQLVSIASMRLNMAALADKGKEFVTPYIIATSNTAIPRPSTISDQEALLRRLQIVIEVTPEPSCVEGTTLSLQKAKGNGKMKGLACCIYQSQSFKHTQSLGLQLVNGKVVSFQAIVEAVLKKLATKTKMHHELLAMVDDMLAQTSPDDDEITLLDDDDPLRTGNFGNMTLQEMETVFVIQKQPDGSWEEVDLMEERQQILNDKKASRSSNMVYYGFIVLGAVILALSVAITIVAVSKSKQLQKTEGKRAYNDSVNIKDLRVRTVDTKPKDVAQSHTNNAAAMRTSIYQIGYRESGIVKLSGYGLFVRGRTLIVTKHCVPDGVDFVIVMDEVVVVTHGSYQRYDMEGDVSAITLPPSTCTEKRDLTGMFVSEVDCERLQQTYAVSYSDCKTGHVTAFSDLKYCAEFDYGHPRDKSQRIRIPACFRAEGTAFPGACGMVWVSCSPIINYGILGIHVAGSAYSSACQIVTREMVAKIMDTVGQMKILAVRPFTGVIARCTKTAFQKSEFYSFSPSNKEPAPLGYWDERVINDPQTSFLVKHRSALVMEPVDFPNMVHYGKAMATRLAVSATGAKREHKYTSLKCIVEGMCGMESLDMKTSPGYPWCDQTMYRGIRKKDLIFKQSGEWVLRPDLAAATQEVVDYIMEPDSRKPDIKYVAYPKDELLSDTKCIMGRTRYISAAPLQLVLAWKHIFGSAVAALHNANCCDGHSLGVAVGLDPNTAWGDIYRCRPGWSVLAVDYSNYDGSLQPFQITGAVQIIGYIAGLHDAQSKRAAELIYHAEQICGKEVYTTFGPLPSGAPSTSLIGCVVNWLTTVYVMCKIMSLPFYSWRDWMYMISYGDDVLLFVHPDYVERYDGDLFRDEMLKFGMTATDALDKNKSPQVTTIDSATFLKRGFRPCDRYPLHVHPTMDKSTMYGMLKWRRKNVTLDLMVFLCLEFMMHHGRSEYEDFVAWVKECSTTLGDRLRGKVLEMIPSYDVLHDQWIT